ncbi:hypothetical protein [Clostridium perfringens]|uniref:hypothetical protein n=1 Tax=Clostridium perfringens TaxID=1502 RepID=UPI0023F9909C|nr:hypothetical protein [Clostridium perfringens]WEV05657.1 hypothetical protein PL322_01385 [Clostridium perfringens B]
MSTISNILKSFLTQNILGYIGVTLILIVICLGFIYNMRVKKKYENLLNAFNESEWINVSNNEDQKELKFLNSELRQWQMILERVLLKEHIISTQR